MLCALVAEHLATERDRLCKEVNKKVTMAELHCLSAIAWIAKHIAQEKDLIHKAEDHEFQNVMTFYCVINRRLRIYKENSLQLHNKNEPRSRTRKDCPPKKKLNFAQFSGIFGIWRYQAPMIRSVELDLTNIIIANWEWKQSMITGV